MVVVSTAGFSPTTATSSCFSCQRYRSLQQVSPFFARLPTRLLVSRPVPVRRTRVQVVGRPVDRGAGIHRRLEAQRSMVAGEDVAAAQPAWKSLLKKRGLRGLS